MKKTIISLLLFTQIIIVNAQVKNSQDLRQKDAKPDFAAIHFSPMFESIKKLKTGFGTSLESAYFINEWFGAGMKINYSSHSYTYTNFSPSGRAGHLGFSGNVFILKKIFNDKISVMPSAGLGFTSTFLPAGTLKTTELVETSPGVFASQSKTITKSKSTVTGFMYNVFGLNCNYNFRPDMSAGVKVEYHISVSNKWEDETLGDFFSIGVGYSYYFNLNKLFKKK